MTTTNYTKSRELNKPNCSEFPNGWAFFAPRQRYLDSRPGGALCWRQIRSSSDLGVICATGTPYRDRPCGTKRRHRMGEVPRRFGRSLRASTVESRNSWGGHAQQTVMAFGFQPVAQRDRPKRPMAGSGGMEGSLSSASLCTYRTCDASLATRTFSLARRCRDERLSFQRLP